MELTASDYIKHAICEEDSDKRVQKISKACKLITDILPFPQKIKYLLNQYDLIKYLLMVHPVFSNIVDLLLESLIDRFTDTDKFIEQSCNCIEKVSIYKEVKRENENEIEFMKVKQNISRTLILQMTQIKLRTIRYLKEIINIVKKKQYLCDFIDIVGLIKSFIKNTNSEIIIVESCQLIQIVKSDLPNLFLVNPNLDDQIDELMFQQANLICPVSAYDKLQSIVGNQEKIQEASESENSKTDRDQIQNDANHVQESVTSFQSMRTESDIEIEFRQEHADENKNIIVAHLENWLMGQKVAHVNKSNYMQDFFKNIDNLEIFLNLVSDQFMFLISAHFKNRYRKLMFLNFKGKEQYLLGPSWRIQDETVSALPKDLILYNMRSYWASNALSDINNYIYIKNNHSNMLENVFNNLFNNIKKKQQYLNMNYIVQIFSQYFIYESQNSLFYFLHFNMLFCLANYLDFQNVFNFVVKLIIHQEYLLLCDLDMNLLFEYIKNSEFLKDQSNILINGDQEINFKKFRTQYKVVELTQPTEYLEQKEKNRFKDEVYDRLKQYNSINSQSQESKDIDAIEPFLNHNKTIDNVQQYNNYRKNTDGSEYNNYRKNTDGSEHLDKVENSKHGQQSNVVGGCLFRSGKKPIEQFEGELMDNRNQLIKKLMGSILNNHDINYRIDDDKDDLFYTRTIRENVEQFVTNEVNKMNSVQQKDIVQSEEAQKELKYKMIYELKSQNRKVLQIEDNVIQQQMEFDQQIKQLQMLTTQESSYIKGRSRSGRNINTSINSKRVGSPYIMVNKSNRLLTQEDQSKENSYFKDNKIINERIYPLTTQEMEITNIDLLSKKNEFEASFILQNERYNQYIVNMFQIIIEAVLLQQKNMNNQMYQQINQNRNKNQNQNYGQIMDLIFTDPTIFKNILENYIFKVQTFISVDQSQLNYQNTNFEQRKLYEDNSSLQSGRLINTILQYQNNSNILDKYDLNQITRKYLVYIAKIYMKLFEKENNVKNDKIRLNFEEIVRGKKRNGNNNNVSMSQIVLNISNSNHLGISHQKKATYKDNNENAFKPQHLLKSNDKSGKVIANSCNQINQDDSENRSSKISIYRYEILYTIVQIVKIDYQKGRQKALRDLQERFIDILIITFFQNIRNDQVTNLFLQFIEIVLKYGKEKLWVKILFKLNLANKMSVCFQTIVNNNILLDKVMNRPIYNLLIQIVQMINQYAKERDLHVIQNHLMQMNFNKPFYDLIQAQEKAKTLRINNPKSINHISSNLLKSKNYLSNANLK